MQKIKILLVTLFISTFTAFHSKADEGMWLPMLLQQINATAMQTAGLKIPVDSIYAINKTSLKDAVVLFGGGCTGELISNQSLLLTNHHCGYGQIQQHSSVEHDYLTNGYWAMKPEEELPCPGLTVTFIIRMEDVSDKIIPFLPDTLSLLNREELVESLSLPIEKSATEGTQYEAKVRPFFYGNKYFLIVTETFTDIRLVGAPPSAIGKFGADADNWMWPRHTGDFSLFRIYAGSDNKPAKYSKTNIPYSPRYFFPISLKGVSENDFTMVYGFPGRTQEYLPSAAIKLLQETLSPARIKIRGIRLKAMDEVIRVNDTVRIQYSAKYAGIENAYKKWQGELRGIKRLQLIERKKKSEIEFHAWAIKSSEKNKKYASLLHEFDNLYTGMKEYSLAADYINEAAFGVELINFAKSWNLIIERSKMDTVTSVALTKNAEKLLENSRAFFKNYCMPVDKKIFRELMPLYVKEVRKDLQPAIFEMINTKYDGDFNKYAEILFNKSMMSSLPKVEAFLLSYTKKKVKAIESDPAYVFMKSIADCSDAVRKKLLPLQQKINQLQLNYMAAQMEMDAEKNFYPDANGTLRVAYGNVKPYYPADGIKYNYYCTTTGVVEKYDPSNYDFNAPEKLLELIEKKDFGRYAHNGEMRICFIASNHTTGGNSGSPVLNAKGQLIGTNFDRVWEGTMSDLVYDPAQCRNITLDICYTLFIIDKFAGAQRLIDEMKILD